MLALGPYEGVLRRCVLALKFANRRDVAVQLGRMLATSWPLDMDFLVPVPLHPARQAARGYNQAHLLAQALEEATRLQPRSARLVVVDGLRRERMTTPQSELRLDAREANVCAAFGPSASARAVAGKRVAIVDDVVTTGST
ncbi:MAG: ComF family protein, partial [Candidatus Eremiobacteraeota bacterium]|nr:ComF family protein [Candidatus Eremiobacteraeota bacterium]